MINDKTSPAANKATQPLNGSILGRLIKGRIWMAALVTVLVSTSVLGQKIQEDKDYYYANGKKIPVVVSLDRIGVIAKDPASAANVRRVESLVSPLGLDLTQELSGGMLILRLRQSTNRAGVLKLVRELRKQGVDSLVNAGLVVHAENDNNPSIVTDEFIAQFKPNVGKEQIDAFNAANGVAIVRREPFVQNQFLLRVTESSLLDALRMANRYQENQLVMFAHPNFWSIFERNETIPNDALFADQWYHRNTGANGGTVDADADTTLAWDFTTGSSTIVIGIVDNGFDLTHEDLSPNLFTNAGEIAGDGIDNDGNGFIDDVNGWNFIGNSNDPSPVGAGDNHGTAVTGVAVARGNNTLGVSGACPNCRFMPLNVFTNCTAAGTGCSSNDASFAGAINYAAAMGARIINNSWGHTSTTGVASTAITSAINNAAAAGALVFFAGGNAPSAGWCGASYPSLVNVFAVSSSSNTDRKVIGHAFGNCIDILSPTRWGAQDGTPTGTLAVTTTDRTGAAGYNSTVPACIGGLTEPGNGNYTNCFSGTSSATPLTSGIAGLILSANPSLTRLQVQRLLQDTADKVEDSVGAYSAVTGFSSPSSGIATHSWGRINAFEAVRIAAPAPGKGGVDIFVRDNRLDWGNTEQPSNTLFEPTRGYIGHWQSMDIKVDAPPYQTAPTAATFDAFVDETPSAVAGDVNRVFVRVRNRGPVTAASVTVKIHWAQFGTALAGLPSDFWTAFPADSSDTSQWHPLGTQTITNLAYSGASVAGCPGRAQPSCGVDLNGDGDTADAGETATDTAQIAQFNFPAPPVDPTKPNHFCLLAIVDSPQDPVSTASRASSVVDGITPTDNNVTHRNYQNLSTSTDSEFSELFFVRNPNGTPIQARLTLTAPANWQVNLDRLGFNTPFPLGPQEQVLVRASVAAPGRRQKGELTITQEQVEAGGTRVMGGLTMQFQPSPPVPPPSPTGKFAAFVDVGAGIPHGTFSNFFKTGFSLNAGLEYMLSPHVSAEGIFGYHRFPARFGGGSANLYQLSGNGKFYFVPPGNLVRPFVNGGIGAYIPSSGTSHFGGNVGAGILFELTPHFGLQGSYNLHMINTSGPSTRFSTVQGGVRFVF